ncbi:hypothetical protein MRX96_044155 [Rhipicephalus microplus]
MRLRLPTLFASSSALTFSEKLPSHKDASSVPFDASEDEAEDDVFYAHTEMSSDDVVFDLIVHAGGKKTSSQCCTLRNTSITRGVRYDMAVLSTAVHPQGGR